ncbi:MAG: type IV pilus modification PilV family protein [Planctomycetota bacterium]
MRGGMTIRRARPALAALPVAKRRRRRGFTLGELLIAIGVLATGMSMVAAVFPAALSETQQSVNDVIGGNICDNALAIARARLRHDPINPPFGGGSLEKSSGLGLDANYPSGTADAPRGFILLGRQMEAGANDYQLVVVAYGLRGTGDTANLAARTATVSNHPDREDRMRATFDNTDNLQVGSPVIFRADGQFAWIVGLDGATAVLNAEEDSLPTGDNAVYVLFEPGGPARSPATYVQSVWTALPE